MIDYLFLIIILLFSVVIHEVAHGTAALYLGDPTARDAGRLTLNPLKHLDPVGSIILPIFLILMSKIAGGGIIFGWAKPVPVNPYNFRDQKYGSAKVAFAGPATNLTIALIFGLALRFLPAVLAASGFYLMFYYIVYINLLLALFNLIPIPPLDGAHILFAFLPPGKEEMKLFLSQFGILILLFILLFFSHWLFLIVSFLFSLIVGVPLF